MAQDSFSYEDLTPSPDSKPDSFSYEELSGEPPARGFKGWAQDIGATALKGAIGVPEALVGLADIPTGGRVGKFLENEGGAVGFRPKQAKEVASDFNSEATKQAQQKFQEAEGIGGKLQAAIENPSVIATAIGESLPAMGAGGVAARGLMGATRLGQMGAGGAALAGAAGEGAMMAGSQASAIRQETEDGLLTPGQAALAAGTGLVGGAVGALGGKVAQKLGIGDVDTMVAQGSKGMAQPVAGAATPLVQQQALKSIPKQIIQGAISEGFLEELPQSVAEQVFQNLALGKDWAEGVDAAIVLGTLSGAAMGGGAAGFKGAMDRRAPEQAPANPGTARVRQAYEQNLLALPAPQINVGPDGTAQTAADRNTRLRRIQDGDIFDVTPITKRSEQMGLNPAAGPMSAAAAVAVDTGTTDQVQQQAAAQAKAEADADTTGVPVIDYADLSDDDRAVVDDYYRRMDEETRSFIAMGMEDDDIPDFDAPGNTNTADFLRALGASDQEIQDALSTTSAPTGPLQSAAGNGPAAPDDAGRPQQGAGATQTPAQGQTQGLTTTGEPTNGTQAPQAVEAAPQGPAQQPAAQGVKPPRGILAKKAQADAARAGATNGQATQPTATTPNTGPALAPAAGRAGVSGVDQPGAVQALSDGLPPQRTAEQRLTEARRVDAESRNVLDALQSMSNGIEPDEDLLGIVERAAAGMTADVKAKVKRAIKESTRQAKGGRVVSDANRFTQLIGEAFAYNTDALRNALNTDVQDAPQQPAGTEAQAAPGEASAPEGGNAAAAGGVPAAGQDAGVRADGVDAPTFEVKPNGTGQYMVGARSSGGARMGQMGVTVKDVGGKKYLSVDDVMVRDEHQGKGVGTGLYSYLLDNLPEGIDGVLSEGSWVKNKQQVPAIHKKLAQNYDVLEIDGGVVFAPRKTAAPGAGDVQADGVSYSQRNADRLARVNAAADPDAAKSILEEEYADGERDFESTTKLESAVRSLVANRKREQESAAAQQKKQADLEAGKWVEDEALTSLLKKRGRGSVQNNIANEAAYKSALEAAKRENPDREYSDARVSGGASFDMDYDAVRYRLRSASAAQADGAKQPRGVLAKMADQKRQAALDRIAKGTAYFGTKDKAAEFITKSGIGDTHEVVQAKAGRFEIRAKGEKAPAAAPQPAVVKESLTTQEPAAPAPAKPAPSANTIFTEDAAAAARALLKKKLSGGTLNSGIDPELLQAGITLAGYHIEKGARTFAAYAKAMVSDLGDGVKPYLKSWYMAVSFDPRAQAFAGMDDVVSVAGIDIDTALGNDGTSFDEKTPDGVPMVANLFGDGPQRQALIEKGFDGVGVDVQQSVLAQMRRGLLDLNVRRAVFKAVPVDVMRMLVPREIPSAMLLRNETVLVDAFTVARETPVPMPVIGVIDSLVAFVKREGALPTAEVETPGGNLVRAPMGAGTALGAADGGQGNPLKNPDSTLVQSDPRTLTESLYQAIRANEMPKDNPALKKLVEAFDGKPADQERMKQAQEELETAIVMVARDMVAKKEGDRTTFDILLRLYERQPNLNIRTSTSIANQAYSTPAPLAYLASRLAGITKTTVAHEPTGGTGMLLIGADPDKAIVNELNDTRIEALKSQGFKPTQKDAATQMLVPEGTQPDAVVTNPPFGSIKDAEGKPVKVKVDGFNLGQIDHLIAARALDTMKEDGRATLILGANKVAGGLSTDDRIFFNWLYSHYNVVGHFEIEGDLYNRQGAGWPVRVITINGRQKSDKFSPVAGTIQRVDNWDSVYEQFTQSLASAQAPRSRATPSADSAGGRVAAAVAAPSQTGGGRPAGGPRGAGNVAGASPRVAADRAKPAAGTVAPVADEQRLNAQPYVPQPQPGQNPDGAARPAKPAGTAAVAEAQGNEFQLPYTPRSSRKDEGVLIPANMAQPTQDALSRLEDEVGDIDEFARKELGYETTQDLHEALMGLQVDSVATSIYQIKQGKAVVIADQTGIGKGRQAASIIRWAARQGMTPVFVSVKPSLFTDMYGDLADIGTTDVTPFIMNIDAWVAGEGGAKLFANKPGTHKNVIQEIANTGRLPEGSNAVFMTYSQINVANVQRQALMALAPNAVFVLDESHNAAGASATGEFVIGTLEAAKGVVYLSATYAKRPDNMPLYFKTDIGEAASDTEGLSVAMASGGLPLQTVVSNNLVKAGQMFRRERSYDGVSIASVFDSKNRELHERMSNEATKALRAIVSADRMFHEVYVKQLADQLAEMGATVQDSAGNQIEQSVQHTEFSSVVHNFVKQMLLGLKAQSAADEAIASLKRGEKPIIAVENTMGSFLNEYAAANGIGQGESLGTFDYRTVLSRALARSRVVIEVGANGDKVKRAVPMEQLDAMTKAAYNDAQKVIDSLTLEIPVSPIDWMRSEITRAGYKVAEITGRNLSVDYTNPKKPELSAIDALEQKDKVNTTRQFNSGNLDALILNVAGSTGISLHASEKFEDQRQRHMIVAQAAGDINIFMQMLGRVHRTGQVRLPKYTILSVDLPTEKRPTAVLSIKMKSLNANTSSNTESATSVKSSDILNKYGDQIVNQYLRDNYALARALDLEDSTGDEPTEDIARKATGRLALQPIATQHTFYDEVEAQYTALIDYLNKTNQNDLEPRTFDFDAKEIRQEVLFDGPNKATPFGEDAIYGEYSIKAQGTPMKPEEIRATMAEHLGTLTPAAHAQKMLDELDAKFNTYYATLDDAGKDSASSVRNIGRDFLSGHKIGATFRVDINSEPFNAVVLNVRNTHKETGNPYSLSKIQVSVAINGALRSLSVPATQFSKIEVSSIPPVYKVEQLFKEQPPNQRETAKIITGNLLAAYGEMQGVRGTIISFTKQDGATEQGILLPKLFDYGKNTRGDFRLPSGEAALHFLQKSDNKDIGRFGIMSRDGNVRVLPSGQGVRVQVPKSKLKGGKYFLDKGLIEAGGDFVSSGSFMVSNVTAPADAVKVLDLLMKKQALYALPSMAEEAKSLAAEKADPEDEANFGEADAPIFYSALRREIEGLGTKSAPAVGWGMALQGLVKNGKVKSDELEWTGIGEWLKLQTGKVSKEDVLAFLDANGVQVTETVLGSDGSSLPDGWTVKMNAGGTFDVLNDAGEWVSEGSTERQAIAYAVGEDDRAQAETKYSQYTLPGGENYREVLLTLPVKAIPEFSARRTELEGKNNRGEISKAEFKELLELRKTADTRQTASEKVNYHSSHWDQPNVLAHIRVNDRVDADGKRVLFVEELQSDWGQDGKKHGFSKPYVQKVGAGEATQIRDAIRKAFSEKLVSAGVDTEDAKFASEGTPLDTMARAVGMGDQWNDFIRRDQEDRMAEARGSVPRAPFIDKTDKWLALSLKRIMKMAVDGGYDRVAFVNGEQSADRYDLSKQVDSVRVAVKPDTGRYMVFVTQKGDRNPQRMTEREGIEANKLPDMIGKELAERAVNDIKAGRTVEYAGLDLKVGGAGMRSFYDKIVPAAVKDVLKKVGGGQMVGVSIDTQGRPEQSNGLREKREWVGPSMDSATVFNIARNENLPAAIQEQIRNVARSMAGGVPQAVAIQQEASISAARALGGDLVAKASHLTEQPGFTITEAMREKVAGGLPLFAGTKVKPRTQGTPADRAVMAMAGEGKSADDILRFIANASKSKFNRQVANLLRRTKANPAVSIGGDMGGGAGFRFLAKYSRKNHEVTLSGGAADRAEQIFLHETVHAATLLALDRGGEHADRMKALYESVKKQGLSDAYGMKNVGEFVAEAFTNKEFQKALKGYAAPGEEAADMNLWDRFVAAVRRILGMSDKSQDALSAALELGVEVMRENMPLRAARSFRAEDGPAYAGSMSSMPENQAPGPQGDAQQGANKGNAVADGFVRLYHGGNAGLSEIKGGTGPGNIFGGIFTSQSRTSAASHGDGSLYSVDVQEDKVLSQGALDELDQGAVADALRSAMPWLDDADFDIAYEAVVDDRADRVDGEDLTRVFREDTEGEASWEAQRIRGELAKNLGFQAIEMNDEHGTSYLVLPGAKVTPSNDQSAPDTDGAFMGIDQTESTAFRKWFGDSKVVDSAGKPLRVFHGTGKDFNTFKKSRSAQFGAGIYFAPDPNAADQFSGMDDGSRIVPVYLSLQNPYQYRADFAAGEAVDFDSPAVPLVEYALGEAAKSAVSRSRRGTGQFGESVRQGLMDRGHDGLIVTYEDGSQEYVAFFPEQIKSAVGNRGTFDPEDADIANFGMADAVQQIKQFDVKTAPKNTWAHYRGMALQALGRRQIVDLYAEELPQLETYNDLVQQMDAEKNDTGAEADRLAQDWGALEERAMVGIGPAKVAAGPAKYPGMDRKLAELMHDATLAKVDPSKPMPAGFLKADYDALKARYDALSPAAQKLFGKARDMYRDHYRAVQQAIKDRIERSEMSPSEKKRMMAALDDKLFKELTGVYFPLARFGQYVIVVKDANGEVKNVTRAETVKEAEAARKELQKAFPAHMGNTVGKVLKQAEFNAGRDAVGKGFMADLMGALDEKGVDDELRDTVAQLYLSSLPDLSWAKHGIHRKGTPGFSQDARRAFAQNMFHGARYLAKLRHSDKLQDLLIEMQSHIRAYEGVEEYDSIQAQQVVDEMVKRHEILMNPQSSPVSTALTSFGFLFHMGLSPASAMVNLTQTALVAYPQMGAKWGFDKAGASLLKASEETVRAKNDLSTILKGDELDAFNQAVKDGTIDVTMAHDLAGIAQGEDQGVMWKLRPVMRAASFMFHHAEKFNRQATFIAAYRLAKEKNPSWDQRRLYEEAKNATYDGHFDYSASNRARIMQGNWQRVILLFKQYAQAMIYTLARNAHQSVKGLTPADRKQARRALGGILATHAAAAGVLGLPLVGPLLTVASWVGGDDDEPWDAEVAMQNAMAELLGPKAAEVLARGFSRLTPFDLSGRVALNKLILPDVQEGLEGKEWAESAMAAALGPVAGIGVNVARGVQKMTDGDYMRGLEDMMPTAIRGPIKALRYAGEGAVDKTGVVITDEVSMAGVLGQASGFAPSQVRRDTERRSAIYGYDRDLTERRSVLMRMFADAQMNGDTETVQEVRQDIAAFNEKNPTRRITVPNLMQSVRNRQRRIDQAEEGVYLPKNRRDALEAVTF